MCFGKLDITIEFDLSGMELSANKFRVFNMSFFHLSTHYELNVNKNE